MSSQTHLAAIFIVHFDVIKGNVVEWQYPQDIELEGIEFQAVCSGLHRVKSDVILFSRQQYMGLSVFENRPSEQERGAQMKAIGLLVEPFHSYDTIVSEHGSFLQHALAQLMENQLNKEDLIHYYTHYVPVSPPIRQRPFPFSVDQSVHQNLRQIMTTAQSTIVNQPNNLYGMDVFHDFTTQFGPSLFVLWKAALLRKRILLIHPPPMEIACKYVYLIHLLSQLPASFEQKRIKPLLPRFTLGVNDIPLLEKQSNQGYIACTPDAIFQVKSDLYDVLVTLPSCSSHRDRMLNDSPPIIHSAKYNAADCMRYQILCQQHGNLDRAWTSQLAAYWTGLCYCLYEERPRSNRDWQQVFGGRVNRPEEDEFLLFQEEQEDATEISTASQVFEAVATNASHEHQQQQLKNHTMLRALNTLTECLLNKLQRLIETRLEGEERVHLYPRDMVQLGLDPQLDIEFIVELAQLYFHQTVYVHGLHNSIGHLSDTLCGCCKQQIQI